MKNTMKEMLYKYQYEYFLQHGVQEQCYEGGKHTINELQCSVPLAMGVGERGRDNFIDIFEGKVIIT